MNPTPHAITDIHTYTGQPNDQLTTWLARAPHHWDYDGDLVIDTPDGEIYPRPGWLLVRWTDDAVTTATPRIAERVYGPQGLLGAYTDRGRALQRILWLIAHHPDKIAADPALALQALDIDPSALGWCPPGCAGDCVPDPAVIARHRQI